MASSTWTFGRSRPFVWVNGQIESSGRYWKGLKLPIVHNDHTIGTLTFCQTLWNCWIPNCWCRHFGLLFSCSLIIHEEKTKEIMTVKEVWICDPNYRKIGWTLLWISLRIVHALRSCIKRSKDCFIKYPNTSKLVKKTRLGPVFSTHFSVFGYLMKHSSMCFIRYSNGLPHFRISHKLELEEHVTNFLSSIAVWVRSHRIEILSQSQLVRAQ